MYMRPYNIRMALYVFNSIVWTSINLRQDNDHILRLLLHYGFKNKDPYLAATNNYFSRN